MARNRVIVRPWAQAFRLNVSYDRRYYDTDYVQRQIFGVRDSVNNGYMYWNNSGDYGMILPDISDTEPYKGETPESASAFKKPASPYLMRCTNMSAQKTKNRYSYLRRFYVYRQEIAGNPVSAKKSAVS